MRGTAVGVDGEASLELQYTGGSERITVTGDGPFAFDMRLTDGESYAVVLPGDEPCRVDGAAGVIDGADVEVGLSCLLSGLQVSGLAAAGPALAPGETEYAVPVPVLQQTATVTAVVRVPLIRSPESQEPSPGCAPSHSSWRRIASRHLPVL